MRRRAQLLDNTALRQYQDDTHKPIALPDALAHLRLSRSITDARGVPAMVTTSFPNRSAVSERSIVHFLADFEHGGVGHRAQDALPRPPARSTRELSYELGMPQNTLLMAALHRFLTAVCALFTLFFYGTCVSESIRSPPEGTRSCMIIIRNVERTPFGASCRQRVLHA